MNWLEEVKEWKNRKFLTYLLIGILTFLNLLAINYVSESRGLADGFGRGIVPVLVAVVEIVLLLYYFRLKDRRLKVIASVGGIVLALSHVYGNYLHYVNDLFESPSQVILLLLVAAGVSLLTVPLFALLIQTIEKCTLLWQSRVQKDTKPVKFLFIKYWLGIFACWVPVFLCYWPVNFIYDAQYQLREAIANVYRNHHPILHTLLMGETYKMGARLWDSVSVGISFYTLIQMLILSAALAYALRYIYLQGVPKGFRVIAFLVSAFFPMNSLFAITATKDVLFAAFFLVFQVLLLEICYHQQKITWKKAVWLVLTGALMIMFRRNAVYAALILPLFLVCVIRGKKRKLTLVILLAGTILLANQVNDRILSAVNVLDDDTVKESMSVPLQQLARVAAYRRDELDEAYYQEMLLYWRNGFETSYNPYLSDPIKNDVNEDLLKSNRLNFYKLWAKVGLKFPGEYIESFLTNTMGYWYMGDTAHFMATGDGLAVYHTMIGMGEEIDKHNYFPPVGWLFNPLFLYGKYRTTPILGFLFRSSTYFWLLVVYAMVMIYRKKYRKIAALALVYLYFATCFMGPWVAIRYIYCVVVCWPLFMLLCFQTNPEERNLAEISENT